MPTTRGTKNGSKDRVTPEGNAEGPTVDIFAALPGTAGNTVLDEVRSDVLAEVIYGVLRRGGYISFTSPSGGGDTKISFASGTLTGAKWVADVRSAEHVLTEIAKAVGVLKT